MPKSSKTNSTRSGVTLPGAHRVIRQRANGFAIYWYAARGGAVIGRFWGETLAEAQDAEIDGVVGLVVAYRQARNETAAEGLFARVVSAYMEHPAYTDLRPATKATYRVWLTRMREEFGACSEAEITSEAVGKWRKEIFAKHGARAADHAIRIFSRVCSFGRSPERKLFSPTFKPVEGFETLYRAPPQDAWPRKDLEKIAQLPPRIADALMLALNTGLRRADLVEIPWSAIDEERGVIRWVTSKGRRKNRRIVIPLTPALRATLARIPKKAPTILTNKWERPWTVHGLAHALSVALVAAGIKGRLHGLRRATATHLAGQGLSSRKIARQLGWSEGDAEAMSAIYVDDEND